VSTRPRIALIHATPVAIEPINVAFKRLWPEATATNLLDDSLASDLAAEREITPRMIERFVELARYTRACGATAILFTCSAFGTAIEAARAALDVPVLKPNEAMLDEALGAGNRIGVLATFEPSVPSFRSELEALARAKGITLCATYKTVPQALPALQRGDANEHDRAIAAAAAEMPECDALLLSQFSMASAAPVIPERSGRKVLSSPASAVLRLRALLS
jgi:Asp/Glu/hydantoin racemase